MLDKRLLVTVASLVMVMSVAVAAAMLPGDRQGPHAVQSSAAYEVTRTRTMSPAPTQPVREYLYVIMEHEGRVAVFGAGSDYPVKVLERLVRHLPAYDQAQLQEGIRVYTYQELEARIEDYTS